MTPDIATARVQAQAEEFLAKVAEQTRDRRRYRDHVMDVLCALDDLITRTREIDALRAARNGRQQAPDRSELVAAIDQRLVTLRSLVDGGQC